MADYTEVFECIDDIAQSNYCLLLIFGARATPVERALELQAQSMEPAVREAGDHSVHWDFSNEIAQVPGSDPHVLPLRTLYPVFHGCYDSHFSVQGHWLLVRLIRALRDAPFDADARAAPGRRWMLGNGPTISIVLA